MERWQANVASASGRERNAPEWGACCWNTCPVWASTSRYAVVLWFLISEALPVRSWDDPPSRIFLLYWVLRTDCTSIQAGNSVPNGGPNRSDYGKLIGATHPSAKGILCRRSLSKPASWRNLCAIKSSPTTLVSRMGMRSTIRIFSSLLATPVVRSSCADGVAPIAAFHLPEFASGRSVRTAL